jgi:alkanesulfonate monooxygenase SsuD/methylene tetrahydromethanopterin reductase-like flavin-dependent oxidoreductase (luciferase family)
VAIDGAGNVWVTNCGGVCYNGKTITIEKFDLWFRLAHSSVPIYLSALFPQMLSLCGEIAQGLLMVFSTPDSARNARDQLGVSAARGGRHLGEIELGSLVPVALAADRKAAYERMRPVLASYLGFFRAIAASPAQRVSPARWMLRRRPISVAITSRYLLQARDGVVGTTGEANTPLSMLGAAAVNSQAGNCGARHRARH